MSHSSEAGPLSGYNSLLDKNLSGYFGNTRMRKHLVKSGLVTKDGHITSENAYRLKMAKKEHRKHVRELLATAIVEKALDMERLRQHEIKKRLEDLYKIELVQKVRSERGQKTNDELIALLSPRDGKKQYKQRKARSAAVTAAERGNTRLPDIHFDEKSRRLYYENTDSLLSDNGARMSESPKKNTRQKSSQMVYPPKPPAGKKKKRKMHRGLLLAKSEHLIAHRVQLQSMAEVTMKFLGSPLNLTNDMFPSHKLNEVQVIQQHCGASTVCVFRELLSSNTVFTFVSRRHRGSPFGLTININGIKNIRVSSCCEYKHKPGNKIGGKNSQFALVSVHGAAPCYRCQVRLNLLEDRNKEIDNDEQVTSSDEEAAAESYDIIVSRGGKREEKVKKRSASAHVTTQTATEDETADVSNIEDSQQEKDDDDEYQDDDFEDEEQEFALKEDLALSSSESSESESEAEDTTTPQKEGKKIADSTDKDEEDTYASSKGFISEEEKEKEKDQSSDSDSDDDIDKENDKKASESEKEKESDSDNDSVRSESSESSKSSDAESDSEKEERKEDDDRSISSDSDHSESDIEKNSISEEKDDTVDAQPAPLKDDGESTNEELDIEVESDNVVEQEKTLDELDVKDHDVIPLAISRESTMLTGNEDGECDDENKTIQFNEEVDVVTYEKIDVVNSNPNTPRSDEDSDDDTDAIKNVGGHVMLADLGDDDDEDDDEDNDDVDKLSDEKSDDEIKENSSDKDSDDGDVAEKKESDKDRSSDSEKSSDDEKDEDEEEEGTTIALDIVTSDTENKLFDNGNDPDNIIEKSPSQVGNDTKTLEREVHTRSVKSMVENWTDVELRNFALSPEQTDELLISLDENSDEVESISLRNTLLNGGVVKLVGVLKKAVNLKMLNLNRTSIGAKDAIHIAEVLSDGKHQIKMLMLHGNPLGDEGINSIISALYHNKTLTNLDIGECNISDEGAKALCAFLTENTSMTDLTLSANNLTSNGWKSIAEALKHNSTLTTLSVDGNKMQDEGMANLCQGIRENKSLVSLDVEGNLLTDNGGELLFEALNQCQSMIDITLQPMNDFTPDVETKIRNLILKRGESQQSFA